MFEGGDAFLEVVLPSAVPFSVGFGDGDLALEEPAPEVPPFPAVELVVIVSAGGGGGWLLLFSGCAKG